MSKGLSYQITLSKSFEEAMREVKEALQKEGFGVLTEIDVQETLKKKIGVDFRSYTILGACNPAIAHEALLNDPEVGLVLPCNVTLDEGDEGVLVSVANPGMLLSTGELGSNSQLQQVATKANERILRVVESLSTA
jgi:uncharacterized protein (DUF302 family)